MSTVVINAPRTDLDVVDALGRYGVATVHEAQGRTGLLSPVLRPVWAGAHVAGNAVTARERLSTNRRPGKSKRVVAYAAPTAKASDMTVAIVAIPRELRSAEVNSVVFRTVW